MKYLQAAQLLLAVLAPVRAAFTWQNVKIGGGGGFVPGIVFHPKTKGVAYARTDIGGLYRLNADDSWTAVTDSIATDSGWNKWGIDAVALDPNDATRCTLPWACTQIPGTRTMEPSSGLPTKAQHGRQPR